MEPETKNSFSEILLEALRTKGVTTEKLAQLTGISDRYLTALVGDELGKLPPAPYVHGYVLRIAEALGMDGEALWQEYPKDPGTLRRSGKRDMLPMNRFVTPQINKRVLGIGALVILVVVYGIIRLPSIVGMPTLTLTSITDMMVVSTSTFTIVGSMNPADELTINGEAVYPESNGTFSRSVELESGFNTFEFRVKRFLGKENVLVRQVFYKTDGTGSRIEQSDGTNQENF
jgi:hypothetical protein